jgi:hypothetical protein
MFIGVRNFKNAAIMPILVAIARFVFKFTSMKTPLSIDDTSKIGKMKRVMYFRFIKKPMFMVYVIELHNPPFAGSLTSIHLKCV